MWFRKFRAVNVGPFDDLSLDLTRGSVGVFGKNGVGKSTLLTLMYSALTNDFGRFPGIKTDVVRNTAPEKAESYIWAEIEHAGHVISIRRNIRAKPFTRLQVDDEKEITDTPKAQERLRDVLGVDEATIKLYVFKPQDGIYDFLSSTPADRAKAYHTLCRTQECEEIWELLGEFLNKDRESNAEVVDNSDELLVAITEAKTRVAEIEERKMQASEKLCPDKFLKKYESVVRSQHRLEDLRAEEEPAKDKLAETEKALKAADVAFTKAEGERHAICVKVEERKPKADSTRAALQAWETYSKYRKRRKELKEEADTLAGEAVKNELPDPPADPITALDALNKESVTLENEIERAKKALAQLSGTGKTACPTCATPVVALHNYIAECKKLALEGPAQLEALHDRIEAIDTYKSAARKYEKWKTGFYARTEANKKSLEALKDVQAPDGDKDELLTWLTEFTRLEGEQIAAFEREKLASRHLDKCRAQRNQAKERVAEIAQGITDNTDEPAVIEKAKRRLSEHKNATTELAALEGEAKGLRRLVTDREEELAKLKAILKKNRKIRQMAHVISVSREVMHRDRLPRRVALLNLSGMEGEINEGLSLFGDPFWVEANSELSFTVHKPGEPPQSAGRLSTGQRVVLALAFWPAVASMWSGDLGMLALDEPTANLDGDNRKFLATAIGMMTAKVRGQRQLLMVTHDPDLRSSFDQVIDLG